MSEPQDKHAPPGLDRRSFIGLSALAASGLGSALAAKNAAAQPRRGAAPVAATSAGPIRGAQRGRVAVFKGVPYGATTAGERRFLRPAPPEPWREVRDALELGPRAPQYQNAVVPEFGVMNLTEPSSEDCLRLNLWTPGLGDGGKRPVMVWLHGGAFVAGSGGWTLYDGTRLADRHDVVLITLNHRLNLFGYLHLAELGLPRFAETRNLGMLDIVRALEWIRDNAEAFGGDPGNVTVFGQSGGGSKVSTLLGMPSARGLFHKAIVQSGSQVTSLTPTEARETALRFLETVGLTPATAERLLSMPYDVLRDAIPRARFAFAPVVDGDTLPANVFEPAASPLSAEVPLLIGATETEIIWDTATQYDPLEGETLTRRVAAALGSSPATAERVIELYRKRRPDASGLDLYFIIATDASAFRAGTDLEAKRKAEQGGASVYKYYFEWYSPVRAGRLRAMHTMDIPFVFDNLEIARSLTGDPAAAQPLADRMAAAWAAFARHGDPNHPGLPRWPVFEPRREATMMFNLESRIVEHPYAEERAAVAAARNA